MTRQTRNGVDTTTERRSYAWECSPGNGFEKETLGSNGEPRKPACGHWNHQTTRKWARKDEDERWTGVCAACGRRKQLNFGCVRPLHPRYFDRQQAKDYADRMNRQAADSDPENWFDDDDAGIDGGNLL